MLVPHRPPQTDHPERCVRCGNFSTIDSDLNDLLEGKRWSLRDPLPGLEPPFWICPDCVEAERIELLESSWLVE